MSKVLIVADHDNSELNPSVAKAVSCAAAIPDAAIDVVVFSNDGGSVAGQAAQIDGVARVLVVNDPGFEHPLAEAIAPQLFAMAGEYSHVFGPSTTLGKDLMPRLAALLDVNQLSDIMSVEGSHTFTRPIYAGNAIITVEVAADTTVVATVRTASFQAAAGGNSAPVENVAMSASVPTHTRFVDRQAGGSDRPDLQTAARVVAGGRGVGSEENFEVIYSFADALGAGVGASRAAVDAGYVPNELQVGQTGKIIAPDLYIAIGISGAIQHLTGIKDAGTIVAINKDSEAPIFEVADIGLVGDLFQVVPELQSALS